MCMIEMNLAEAQLFRMLVGIFGRDRVVWSMSVRAVCGGELPKNLKSGDEELRERAERDKCLFTIVDDNDIPKMVMELEPDFTQFIELEKLERQRWLPSLLSACGVQYVTMSASELGEITNPEGKMDFISFLQDKVGVDN
jgi:hypothetical protein